ncbi:hypothetical protein [Flectobacillus major]|uniref:hypothetical protein n=1 Tax=Flectobacillus major TaxID=103 RepID=UPI0004115D21|nr:hypothetical protein [Flectobacillus major]
MKENQVFELGQNKRLLGILMVIPMVLLVPFTAMQFTNEVNWTLFDFVVAGVLLLSVGLALELVLRKVKTIKLRMMIGLALLVAFLLVWAELAVGIFGSPFAGN